MPFSLRLTHAERAALERRAGQLPLGRYVKDCLFAANDNAPVSKARRKRSAEQQKALAAILARLGQSGSAANLRALVEAARSGSLAMTPETEAALLQACRDIAEIKALLMRGLGVKER